MPIFAAIAVAFLMLATIAGARAADTLGSGTFAGASGHDAGGMAKLVRDGDTVRVELSDDFFLEEAPAARVAFGKDGYVRGTIFAEMNTFKGAQSFTVPATFDVSQYNEVWLWCETYNVPLAVAKLQVGK
jgi:hypothetical protein